MSRLIDDVAKAFNSIVDHHVAEEVFNGVVLMMLSIL